MKHSLDESLRIHADAAGRLADTAEDIGVDRWFDPVGDGKWTPSQIVEHLNSTYDVLLSELRGGAGMKVRTKWLRRLVLRLLIAPRILAGRGFPANAPAPPELRPSDGREHRQSEAISRFRDLAEEFDAAVRGASADQTITHAYFGKASIAEGALLCARHIEHHCAQLPSR